MGSSPGIWCIGKKHLIEQHFHGFAGGVFLQDTDLAHAIPGIP